MSVLIVNLIGNQPVNLYINETFTFNINSHPHPFYIQKTPGTYDPAQVYVGGGGPFNLPVEVDGNGTTNSTLTFTPTIDTPKTLYFVADGAPDIGNQINILDPRVSLAVIEPPDEIMGLGGEEVPCYCKGTLILTNQGYIKIEDIKKNDLVLREGIITPSGTLERNVMVVPVIWISSFKVKILNSQSRPICITKNAFGEHYPCEDLYISPAHKIFINDKLLLEANDIINGNTIYQDNECESVEYYHLECEEHSAIYANCILSETYIWRKDIFDGDKGIFDEDK